MLPERVDDGVFEFEDGKVATIQWEMAVEAVEAVEAEAGVNALNGRAACPKRLRL